MTCPATDIGEHFSSFRHKLPIVAGGMKAEFKHTICISIANLTVPSNYVELSMVSPAGANYEFSHAVGTVKCPIRPLGRKALVTMLMPIQNHVNIMTIKHLPKILAVGLVKNAGTEQWDMPVGQCTEI